ncbi:MAG: hypothetical protein HRT71_02465 [Flavobacteriales bacterium]|nr:hypothetical protein [Flavobacteriales bacterium]
MQKKSHIIPDFMYKGMFNSKHEMTHINMNSLHKPKTLYNGAYDKEILCRHCDGTIIGTLESYAQPVLFGGKLPKSSNITRNTFISDEGLKHEEIKGLDYTKFKLFVISILWRAHHSKHLMFEQVNLGAIHSENMRKMILTNNAGNEKKYSVVILKMAPNSDLPLKSMQTVTQLKSESNYSYIMYINGLFYTINISDHNKQNHFNAVNIRENGDLTIPVLEGSLANSFFDSFSKKKLRLRTKK